MNFERIIEAAKASAPTLPPTGYRFEASDHRDVPIWNFRWYPNNSIENQIDEIQWYQGWADNEYGSTAVGVVTGNWNNVEGDTASVMSRLFDIFEGLGFDCEWSDEHSSCGDCGKLMRTSPDSYSWNPEFVVGDGEITCTACMADEWPAQLEALAHCRGELSVGLSICDPSLHGYRPVVVLRYGFDGWHNVEQCKSELDACGVGLGYFLQRLEGRQFGGSALVWVARDSETPDDLHGDHDEVEQYDNGDDSDDASEEN